MGEQITIKKKKKLTIKSRAENSEPVNTPGLGIALPGIGAPPVASGPAASYTLYVIFAIIATLMFIAILALQWTEWTFLLPAFPRPVPVG